MFKKFFSLFQSKPKKQELQEFTVVILGLPSAGKSHLIYSFYDLNFPVGPSAWVNRPWYSKLLKNNWWAKELLPDHNEDFAEKMRKEFDGVNIPIPQTTGIANPIDLTRGSKRLIFQDIPGELCEIDTHKGHADLEKFRKILGSASCFIVCVPPEHHEGKAQFDIAKLIGFVKKERAKGSSFVFALTKADQYGESQSTVLNREQLIDWFGRFSTHLKDTIKELDNCCGYFLVACPDFDPYYGRNESSAQDKSKKLFERRGTPYIYRELLEKFRWKFLEKPFSTWFLLIPLAAILLFGYFTLRNSYRESEFQDIGQQRLSETHDTVIVLPEQTDNSDPGIHSWVSAMKLIVGTNQSSAPKLDPVFDKYLIQGKAKKKETELSKESEQQSKESEEQQGNGKDEKAPASERPIWIKQDLERLLSTLRRRIFYQTFSDRLTKKTAFKLNTTEVLFYEDPEYPDLVEMRAVIEATEQIKNQLKTEIKVKNQLLSSEKTIAEIGAPIRGLLSDLVESREDLLSENVHSEEGVKFCKGNFTTSLTVDVVGKFDTSIAAMLELMKSSETQKLLLKNGVDESLIIKKLTELALSQELALNVGIKIQDEEQTVSHKDQIGTGPFKLPELPNLTFAVQLRDESEVLLVVNPIAALVLAKAAALETGSSLISLNVELVNPDGKKYSESELAAINGSLLELDWSDVKLFLKPSPN